jgi:hypothetical protein
MRANNDLATAIQEAVSFAQGIVLDAIEQEVPRGSDGFNRLRSKVFRAMGERGLERRLERIISNRRGVYCDV